MRGKGSDPDLGRRLAAACRSSDHWLEGADLSGQDLSHLELAGLKAPGADLGDCTIRGTDLSGAVLDAAILSNVDAAGSHLGQASLRDVVMGDTSLAGVHLEGAIVTGRSVDGNAFNGAYLTDVSWDTQSRRVVAPRLKVVGEYEDANFRGAAAVYSCLRDECRAMGEYHHADRLYGLQMTSLHLHDIGARRPPQGSLVQRVVRWLPRPFWARMPRAVGWALNRWLWAYGIAPGRLVLWMLLVVLLGAAGFSVVPGRQTPTMDASRASLAPAGAVGFTPIDVPVANSAVGRGGGLDEAQDVVARTEHLTPHEAITVSLVAFTTLGCRDPGSTPAQLLAGLEALLGALLMNMFVVALVMRFVRR